MTKQNSIQEKCKKDALTLTEGPHLAGYAIQHSDALRLLIIDGSIVHFTPTEYSLLLCLLKQSEHHLSFAVLEQCLFLRFVNSNPRSALIRHMRRIRPKVYELIAKEGLPVIRFGRSVRVSAASLQKWVEQREQQHLAG